VNDLLSRYRKAYPRLFRDPGFKHLTPLGKLLVMYLLFGPQSNRLGLFFFSLHTAADDLDTTAETLRKALADVATTFGWHFDADARVFYVPTWWKWNPPENANVMRGALKDLAEIPPCSLVDAFAANVTDIPDEPVKGGANILQTFVEGLRQRLPERSGNQKQYAEQYRKREQEPRATRKGGSDEKHADAGRTNGASNPRTARIETLARKTLTYTDPNGDMTTLIDTMFTIARSEGLDDLSKTEALDGLNLALAEGRTH